MKTPFVAELVSEQTVTAFFIVCEKEVRNTRDGKPYLRMELGDRTGTLEARMWDQFEVHTKDIARDDFVKVQGRVELYRGKPQISLQQVRIAKPEEVDLADFLPHTKENVEKMYADLLGFASSIENPWLSKLVAGILNDPKIAPRDRKSTRLNSSHSSPSRMPSSA